MIEHQHVKNRKIMNTKSIMDTTMQELSTKQNDRKKTMLKSWRHAAWILILTADAGLLAWGATAAMAPEHSLRPGSAPILNAEY